MRSLNADNIISSRIDVSAKNWKDKNRDIELICLIIPSLPKAKLSIIVEKLLNEFGSIYSVIHADRDRLLLIEGIEEDVCEALSNIRELFSRSLSNHIAEKNVISCWRELLNYLKFKMSCLKVEHFRILFLNQKNVILADELLGVGTVNQAPVYVREIVKRVLFHEASSIILIHNHPSEDPTPSRIDLLLTLKNYRSLQIYRCESARSCNYWWYGIL
ncbi:MAG: hypothetical protein EOP33_04810 [Rickettsiaceae bacterium]|nr:MAG: hypothetical protein EOP33_04810 [Rickettsiaceae bacterium]